MQISSDAPADAIVNGALRYISFSQPVGAELTYTTLRQINRRVVTVYRSLEVLKLQGRYQKPRRCKRKRYSWWSRISVCLSCGQSPQIREFRGASNPRVDLLSLVGVLACVGPARCQSQKAKTLTYRRLSPGGLHYLKCFAFPWRSLNHSADDLASTVPMGRMDRAAEIAQAFSVFWCCQPSLDNLWS